VNGGHECLVVEARALGDPVQTPFRADLDRHVGQRNVTVIEAGTEPQPMQLIAPNPFLEPARVDFRIRTIRIFGTRPLIEHQTTLLSLADVLTHIGDPALRETIISLGVEFAATDEHEGLQIQKGKVFGEGGNGFDSRVIGQLREQFDPDANLGDTQASIEIAGGGTATVAVEAKSPGHPDRAIVHHITQTTDGVPTGGYTIVLV
jgi:hypothetical protein